MKIAIGSDHGGFIMKEELKEYLKEKGYDVTDCGTYSEESIDYPDIAMETAKKIISKENELGVLLCGTGIGISIAANKIDGIRAALCTDCYCAKMARNHNDANVLCMGGRVIDTDTAVKLADIFLNTPFEGGRHINRVCMIKDIEEKE